MVDKLKKYASMRNMKDTLHKKKVGGYRVKRVLEDATSIFLEELWEYHGGPTALSEKTGYTKQFFTFWKSNGQVPFKKLGKISKALNISPWYLNYEGLAEIFSNTPEVIPNWEKLVRNSYLHPVLIKKVLEGNPPKLKVK